MTSESTGSVQRASSKLWRVRVPLAPSPRPWLNANEREHWGRRKQLSQYYRQAVRSGCRCALVPQLDAAYVMALVSFGSPRRRDAHNVMPTIKACIDGLVDAHVIPDDSDKYLIGPDIRRVLNPDPGIVLLIASKETEEIECLLSPESWRTLVEESRKAPDGVPCDAHTTVIRMPRHRSTSKRTGSTASPAESTRTLSDS